ncbi:MAG TPA: iron-sulfur cluster assembly protein [Pseudonocardiaceae bacterium]
MTAADVVRRSRESIELDVVAALDRVVDPCSQSWQRPLSIVDLGLIRRVTVDTRCTARIDISLTTPFCLAITVIMQAIEQRVGEVPEITDVDVHVDPTVVWSIDLMTQEGRERLLAHRRGDTRQRTTGCATPQAI